MALEDKRLTDLTEILVVPDEAWIHVVNPSDTSQHPDGSSFKAKKENVIPNVIPDMGFVVYDIVSGDLTTQDADGITSYINALSPSVLVPTNVVAKWRCTDTNHIFELQVNGASYGDGNTPITSADIVDFGSNQIKDKQIRISASQDVDEAWDGQTILFDTTCTITVPSSLPEQFTFNFITLGSVTITWAITSPHTWLFATPAPTEEKTYGNFTKVEDTNDIILAV